MRNRIIALAAACCLLLTLSAAPSRAAADADPYIGPGCRFYFGSFEQDGFSVNGREPIVWRVLDTDNGAGLVLAVSEFGLCAMKYHRNNSRTSWGDSDVRDWLNYTFVSSFTPQELSDVAEVRVSGSRDRFFLLDSAQITRYLSAPYLCYATPWALTSGESGAYVNEDTGASSWLVRTDVAEKRIAWVGGGGKLYSPEGKKGVNYLTSKDNVVRPAMWVSRDAVLNEAVSWGFPPYAKTLMRISTRSGPSTGYNGLGDYFDGGGHLVRVLSRVHDSSIWWLQIEFEYNGSVVRCYTGLKRVDVDISRVPDERTSWIGSGTVTDGSAAWYGPGFYYKRQPERLVPPAGTTGNVVAAENGWYCLEYDRGGEMSRVWLPGDALAIR